MPSLNATGRSGPDPADVPTFMRRPTAQVASGPLTLYRFGSESGRWWYGQSLIDTLKADFVDQNYGGERPRSGFGDITLPMRDGLAVSHEWNAFTWLCTLTLQARQAIDCWVGETSPQPQWQSKPDGRILHGGLTQYLIYDVVKLPPGLVRKQPTSQLWREWSRNLGRFGSAGSL